MFLYRKGNQSFGMCKQKEEKTSRNLIFFIKHSFHYSEFIRFTLYQPISIQESYFLSYIMCF